MNTLRPRIVQRINEVMSIAKARYGFTEPLDVRFDLKGLTRGTAQVKRVEERFSCVLRFNLDAFALDPEDGIRNNVPHEIAHLIVSWRYLRDRPRRRPRSHGIEWRSICLALGGNADPRHSLDTNRARVMTVHEYVLPRAGKVSIGPKRHAKIQKGTRYRLRRTSELICADHYIGETRQIVKASDK